MKLNIEIDTGDKASLQSLYEVARAMMGLSGDTPSAKPASPPKAAATSAPTPAPTASAPSAGAPAAASAAASTPATASASPGATSDTADLPTAQKAFQDYVKANGPAKAKAIIAEFGVASLAAMPAEQYSAFVARLAA